MSKILTQDKLNELANVAINLSKGGVLSSLPNHS